jgi:serine/threonine protein kinase
MTTVLLNSSTQAITATGGSVGGTLRYMAPELHNDNPKLTVLSDIYALAITLWEVRLGTIRRLGVTDPCIVRSCSLGRRRSLSYGRITPFCSRC